MRFIGFFAALLFGMSVPAAMGGTQVFTGVFDIVAPSSNPICLKIFDDHRIETRWTITGPDRHAAVAHFVDRSQDDHEKSFMNEHTLVGRLGTTDVLLTKSFTRNEYRYVIEAEGYFEADFLYLETTVKIFEGRSGIGDNIVCMVTADYFGSRL